MFYLYILYSPSADKYFVGHTENVEGRLFQHNHADVDTYSSAYRPWELKAVFAAGETRAAALGLERFIKKQKSRRLLERLVDPDFIPEGSLAQLVRVPHVRD